MAETPGPERHVSDLYGDDILLWSEQQAALLRRLATGERVSDAIDWQHVIDEVESVGSHHQPAQEASSEIAEVRRQLEKARARIANLEAKLAAVQDQAEGATARAVAAAEAEQALRQADAERRARGLLTRLRQAWQRK